MRVERAMGATDIVEQVNATVLGAGDDEGGKGDVNWEEGRMGGTGLGCLCTLLMYGRD